MVMFLGFMIAITLVMWLAPDSAAGRAMHRNLVERPLEALAKFERHHLIYFVIMLGFMIGGGEVFAILGPEAVAAFALDFAIYIDAVLVTYALSAAAMAKRSASWMKRVIIRPFARIAPRRKRTARRSTPRRSSANDDDPDPARLPLGVGLRLVVAAQAA